MNDKKQNTSNRGGSGGGRQGSGRKKKSRKKKVDPRVFWGDHEALPTPDHIDTHTLEPVAVVSSLGHPPIPGQQAASQHYFRLVYDRASQLGIALGHAGGLDDLRPNNVEDDAHNNVEDEPLREVGADEQPVATTDPSESE